MTVRLKPRSRNEAGEVVIRIFGEPAGKARIALNALRHALSSMSLVLPSESSAEWEIYRQTIVSALSPVGPIETALAERVAAALRRLRRVTAYEDAAIAERQHLEAVSARLLPRPLDIDKIIRFEAHLTRQLYQALHELEALRVERLGQVAPLLRVTSTTLRAPSLGPKRPPEATLCRRTSAIQTAIHKRDRPPRPCGECWRPRSRP